MNKILKQVETEIRKELLPEIPIGDFKIKKIYSKKDYLGFYKSRSVFNIPIIKLNITCIKESEKEVDITLYSIILTTIIHELGHAIQELKGKYANEKEAEDFAFDYWNKGIINKI